MERKILDLGEIFDKHVEYEFVQKDVNATMLTMTDDPYVHHVPTLTGGKGYDGVSRFYKEHFIGKMPNDIKMLPISRTIGNNQVVDEIIVSFTHDCIVDFMLPNVPPTGRYVEIPLVVVMHFKNNKISYEHIYWDQASVLVQIGLLKTDNLPISGENQAKKLLELCGK